MFYLGAPPSPDMPLRECLSLLSWKPPRFSPLCKNEWQRDKSHFQMSVFTSPTIRQRNAVTCHDLFIPPLCVSAWNSTERKRFAFNSCLVISDKQTTPVWIKAIHKLLLVPHCSLITVTPFQGNILQDFYHPSLLILSHSLVVEGDIWRILFSDHTKLPGHMPTFSFPAFS